MINREVDHYIKLYLTGELEVKIKRCRARIEKGLGIDFYQIKAYNYSEAQSSNSNNISDPTAAKAIKYADYHYQLKHTLDLLISIQKVFNDLQGIDGEVLEAGVNMRTLADVSLSNYKAKMRQRELKSMLEAKIGPLIDEYIERL